MKDKEINVRIANEDIHAWESFKHVVLEKHGKLHGVLGDEVMKAIKLYIEHQHKSIRTRTHVEDEPEKQSSPKKKQIKEIKPSPYHARSMAIQKRMKELGAWDTAEFQKPIAIKFIKEVCGGDKRTVDKYCSALESYWSLGK